MGLALWGTQAEGAGDGLTDVPCMKLVKINGGTSIAVFQDGKRAGVEDLLRYERVDFISPADYSKDSHLDIIVRDVICKMAMVDNIKIESKKQRENLTK
jgi:hypothetical protein